MSKLNKIIKEEVRGYLNEQKNPEDIKQYIGNTFDVQDSTAENTVGKRKDDWGLGGVF